MTIDEKLKKAIEKIESVAGKRSSNVAIILGSGLGLFGEKLDRIVTIPYSEIPFFPLSTVQGHSGKLTLANDAASGKNYWVMQGRVHFYEGYSMDEVTFPVRLFSKLGVNKLLVTNASGGINTSFEPADLMLIKDHINFFGTNPLIGKNQDSLGVRFPDMSEAYSKSLSKIIKEQAAIQKIDLKEGVYLGVTGPSFETPAEIRAFRILGGDAVGMSTVPEVIVAKHSGIKVAGISFISNKASGIGDAELTHEEVNENATKVEVNFAALVGGVINKFLESN